MEKDWALLYSTHLPQEAELLKNLLEHNDIDVILVNKKDSLYVTIGEVELYVKRDELIKAKFILENRPNE